MTYELATNETSRGRTFTAPRNYTTDARALHYLLHDLKCLIDAERVPINAHSPIEWEANGLGRRVIVCDYQGLTSAHDELCFVGFFGERHLDRSSEALEVANAEIVLEFQNYPGILSYSSMELYDGNWANMVIHDLPAARENWRGSARHAEAATRLSPDYYRNVRIHNGIISGGLNGGGAPAIQTTKYWDYEAVPLWQAVRNLVPATPELHTAM